MILCFTFLWCMIPDRLPCPLRISSNFSLPDTNIKVIKVFRSQNLKKKTLPDEYLQNRIFVHSDMMMDSGWRRRKGNWGERRKKNILSNSSKASFFPGAEPEFNAQWQQSRYFVFLLSENFCLRVHCGCCCLHVIEIIILKNVQDI